MKKILAIIISSIVVMMAYTDNVFAVEHSTVIINQVRGNECCSIGSIENLENQIEEVKKLDLSATFALRYDVLSNQQYIAIIQNYLGDPDVEWSAFLEITPQLAQDAGVSYAGADSNWYEAQFAYLIGYSQEDREKLLETYMARFEQVFGRYPQSSTAWMIDPFSLQLLKEKYGVLIHQITREQIGVDSYTLYGGPVHYPYYPSKNWALIPQSGEVDQKMPIIVRQTITDPVYNYGDDSSSYTSQPNDYALRKADFNYFEHLFLQAHSQSESQDTFALLGLENSMPEEIQQEFFKQLSFVSYWSEKDANNFVLTARDYAQKFAEKNQSNQGLNVYEGEDQLDPSETAWWVTTPSYRLRLRLSNKELFISDLRVYDNSFTDPYLTTQAKKLGWWIAPFVVDGSRYLDNDRSNNFAQLANDSLKEIGALSFKPTRLVLANKIEKNNLSIEVNNQEFKISDQKNQKILAVFKSQEIALDKSYKEQNRNSLLDEIKKSKAFVLNKISKENNLEIFEIKIKNETNLLDKMREEHYPLLFPELKEHDIDVKNTYLHKNNVFAIAGRNPVRLALFPRDEYNYPIDLKTAPKIEAFPEVDQVEVKTQSGYSGMLFLDFNNAQVSKNRVTIKQGNWSETLNIYFAPNCKNESKYCLTHPLEASWYLMSFVGDQWRALKEKVENL